MGSFRTVKLLDDVNNVIIPSGLVPRGAYNGATDYAVGDSVDYNGSSYVMFVDAAAGTLPTDTSKWQVLANKGSGACGVSGVSGADSTVAGPAGACGVSGVSGISGVAGACGVSGVSGAVISCSGWSRRWLVELVVSSGVGGVSVELWVSDLRRLWCFRGVREYAGVADRGTAGSNGACGISGVSGITGVPGSDGQSFTWEGTWSILTTYDLDDVVVGSDDNDYISKQNTNLAHDPTLDGAHTWWDVFTIKGPVGAWGGGYQGFRVSLVAELVEYRELLEWLVFQGFLEWREQTEQMVQMVPVAFRVSAECLVLRGQGVLVALVALLAQQVRVEYLERLGLAGFLEQAGAGGACGVSGISGVTGVPGSNGACGISGISGISGVPGPATLAGNFAIDGLPDSDHTAVGPTTNSFASGYTAAAFDLVFMGSASKWLEVDADAVATCKGMIGICSRSKK